MNPDLPSPRGSLALHLDLEHLDLPLDPGSDLHSWVRVHRRLQEHPGVLWVPGGRRSLSSPAEMNRVGLEDLEDLYLREGLCILEGR